jgi:hypothetical protein
MIDESSYTLPVFGLTATSTGLFPTASPGDILPQSTWWLKSLLVNLSEQDGCAIAWNEGIDEDAPPTIAIKKILISFL